MGRIFFEFVNSRSCLSFFHIVSWFRESLLLFSFICSISISSKKLHQMPWSVQQEEAPGVTKRGDETVVIKITLRGRRRRGGYVPKSSTNEILTSHTFWNFVVQWLVLLFGDDTIYIYIWDMISDTWYMIHNTWSPGKCLQLGDWVTNFSTGGGLLIRADRRHP